MTDGRIVVRGLDELRRELRRVDPRLSKTLQVANKRVSEKAVSVGGPKVRALPSPGGSVAQSGLRPRASQKSASINLLGSNPTIRASVFGAKSHMVWGRRAAGPGPWQPWIGKTWHPEQLYGLGPALTQVADGFALDEYADAWMDGLKHAFPD